MGFAAMDPKRELEIARKGRKAAHRIGVAHEFTSEEARAAAKKSLMTSLRTAFDSFCAVDEQGLATNKSGRSGNSLRVNRSQAPLHGDHFREWAQSLHI